MSERALEPTSCRRVSPSLAMELETLLSGPTLPAQEEPSTVAKAIQFARSRGHSGRINCVGASEEVDYILSGGEDHTMRVWRFAPEKQAYELESCLLVGDRGASVDLEQGSLLGAITNQRYARSRLTESGGEVRGVTAVATAGSRKDAMIQGVRVQVENDAEYIKEELDYMDGAEWTEEMEEMLGREYLISRVDEQRQTVVLAMEDGADPVELPKVCVIAPQQPYRDGPFIAGTSDGDVAILCLWSAEAEMVRLFPRLHAAAVNDLCVIRSAADLQQFIVVTAGDDGEAAMLDLTCKEVQPDGQDGKLFLKLVSVSARERDGQPIRIRHESEEGLIQPVLKVRPIGDDAEGVSFATMGEDGVRLWSIAGDFLMKLTMQRRSLVYDPLSGKDVLKDLVPGKYTGLSVVNKDTGSLLFIASETCVGVWFVDDGMVTGSGGLDKSERRSEWQKALATYQEQKKCIKPITVYFQNGSMLDVDQSGADTVFAVDVRHDFTCTVWNLRGSNPDYLAVEPPGPANTLVMPGREIILLEMLHASKVCDSRVFEDPEGEGDEDDKGGAGGPALVVGCEDGSVFLWDLEGSDRGQIYAQMRSLKLHEILLPLVLLFVSSVQVLSYAFGPAIPWREEVQRPAERMQRLALFDWSYEFTISREAIFWPQIEGVLALMIVSIFVAVTGAHENLESMLRWVQNTPAFKLEASGGSCLNVCHLTLRFLKLQLFLVTLLASAVNTVLVVPMTQAIASAFDCVPSAASGDASEQLLSAEELLGAGAEDQFCAFSAIPCHLAAAPSVECYRGDHLRLIMVIGIIAPVALFLCIPYAASGGDSAYMPRSTIYDFKFWRPDNMWRKAAQRKATVLSMNFLHPNPPNFFGNQIMDLFVKVLLPVITTETTRFPMLQMALVTAVNSISLIFFVFYPPFLEPMYLGMVRILKIFTTSVMAIGLLTVFLNDSNALLPIILLVFVCSLTCLWLIYTHWANPLPPIRARLHVAADHRQYAQPLV